mmetsp:Transcript_101959/g.161143  ORF Transcript_101959/g.161143 Transcript_101959/m.161143 type:complete len:360 (+) Transcript_101959:86-1165(+)
MADRENELVADRENAALKKLQAFAGVAERTRERVDWMYEQSVAKKTDEELMNEPVSGQASKDMEDVKALDVGGYTSGSLFLKGPTTKTTEDVLRKLREDPLFQIRREEQAARQSMMQNPLIQARLKKKMEKASKKEQKKAKKAAKKEKKAMKKAKKANKKASKKSSSSSSSASSGGAVPDNAAAQVAARALAAARERAGRGRSRSGSREGVKKEDRKEEKLDLAALGPNVDMVNKREDYAAKIAERKRQALESRGAPRRMDEDEKKRRYEQMVKDAKSHDAMKNRRISEAERKEKEQAELEEKQREASKKIRDKGGDQEYFRKIREEAYMESNAKVADRLKNQRHRRQKGVVDSLEKDQ